ncbi:putative tRNA 2'-phosphotransferase 1 [Halenospora varia]|nr:putative tRNA 2'-phosphotransferase 1 [Halenospora varia]
MELVSTRRDTLGDSYILPLLTPLFRVFSLLLLRSPVRFILNTTSSTILFSSILYFFTMAAAVMQPMSGLSLDGGIMAPSPVSGNNTRHGRSKHGGSVAKKGRGRGYSVVDDREGLITKALTWVLKRTITKGEQQVEGEEKLVADADGWVDCEEVLQKPNLSSLDVTFEELQTLVSASKSKFALKLKADSEADEADESDYLIRIVASSAPSQTPVSPTAQKLTPLTTTTEDLPDLIVYESSIKVDEDGVEVKAASDADVSIYIDLRAVMEANPTLVWARTEAGNVVTEGDAEGGLEKKYWKKAVARRGDIGVLFEDGEVRKEIPIGLRGKGVKGKKGGGKGKGKEWKEMKARTSEDESGSE